MTSPGCYSGREHIYERSREPQKEKTAPSKGKRYHCAVCGRRSPKKVLEAPWYCPKHDTKKHRKRSYKEWSFAHEEDPH